MREISPQLGFDPRTVQLVASRYSGPIIIIIIIIIIIMIIIIIIIEDFLSLSQLSLRTNISFLLETTNFIHNVVLLHNPLTTINEAFFGD